MRYIVNSSNYVLAVGFGCDLRVSGKDCTEYTGSIPSGWNSLEEWYEDEGDKLWRWKIVSGNLTLDSSAKAPEEGRWGEPLLQDKTLSGLYLKDTVVTPDEDYDGLGKVTIKAQKMQNKSVAGPFLTQTTVQADSNYDALGSVVIAAQPYWKEYSESEVYVSGGGTGVMVVTSEFAGRTPKAIFIDYTSSKNGLAQWLTTGVFILLSDGVKTYTHAQVAQGGGDFFAVSGGYSVTIGSDYVEVTSDELYTFYNSNSPTRYKVYLMY